jgi:hypothetical protein
MYSSRRKMIRHNLLIPTILLLFIMEPVLSHALSPSDLIIVYNSNMHESKEVARYYAKKRRVPYTQLLAVDVSTSERMSRNEFESKLIAPVRKKVDQLKEAGAHPAILLVYGIPLAVTDPEGNGADPEKDFEGLLERKAAEYTQLAIQLANDLDRLTGGSISGTRESSEPDKPYTAKEALQKVAESFESGCNSWITCRQTMPVKSGRLESPLS